MTNWTYRGKVVKLPPADPDEIRAKLPEYLTDAVRRRPPGLRLLGRNPEFSDPEKEGEGWR